MSVWKSDETLLSICILNFSFKNDFVWEEISNIRHSVSSPDETPRSSSKILRCASYFQLSSRCFIWWWNTASHVWYITWKTREENTILAERQGATFYLANTIRIEMHQSRATLWAYKRQSVIIQRPHCLKTTCSNNRTSRSKFTVTASRDNW